MTAGKVLGLVVISLVLAGGQLLFKMSANRIVFDEGLGPLVASFFSPAMIFAVTIFGVATILWVVLLSGVPLNRAYPFLMLSFLFVPIVSSFAFGEQLSVSYFVGLFMMMGGAAVIVVS